VETLPQAVSVLKAAVVVFHIAWMTLTHTVALEPPDGAVLVLGQESICVMPTKAVVAV
jgi:hypothetical protein